MPAASPPSAQPSQVVGTRRPGTDDVLSPVVPGPSSLSSAAAGSPIRTKYKPPDPLPPERHSEICQAVTLTLATCVLLAGVALFFVAALCGAGAPRRTSTGCAAGLPLNPRAWVGLAAAVLFVGTVLLAALVWYLAWVKKEHNKARRAHEAAWRAFRVRAMPNAADRKIAALNLPLPITSPLSTEPHDGVYYNNNPTTTTTLRAGAGSPPPPPPDVWRIPPPPSPMSRAEVAHALAAMDAERSLLLPTTQRLPSASADVATLSPLPGTNFHSLVPGAPASESPPPPISTSRIMAVNAPGPTKSAHQAKAAPDLPQHPVRPLFAGYGTAAQPAAPAAARTTGGSRHVATLSRGAAAAPPATPPPQPRAIVAGASAASPPPTRPPPKFVMMPAGSGVRRGQQRGTTDVKGPRDDDAGRASDTEEEGNVMATQHDARFVGDDGDYSDPETMPPSPTVRALMAAAPPAPPRPPAQQRPPPPPPRPNV